MVQEARAGARGRQQSASAATTGRAAGAMHTAKTGVAKVALRWNNGCGTDTAARAVGLFAKRPGEKPQKRCGGEGMPMQRKSVAGTTNKGFPCCARSTSGHTFSTRRRKHKEVATDTRTGNAMPTVGNG